MSNTYRDKLAKKLKMFNESFETTRGNSNQWEKELTIAVIRPDEIAKVFPRGFNKQRKQAMKQYRAACKAALRAGHELPDKHKYFDFWFWD